ncbi:MAG: efflux RND transporter permease subunit, partial [Oxalobacteraceae bacterium]
MYGVSGEDDPIRLRTLLEEEITPLIESADGVAQVVITGGQERAVIIDVDPAKLQAYDLAMNDVTRRISAENVSLPAGIAAQGGRESTIRSTGYFTSIKEAEDLPLGVYGGRIVQLRHIA